MQIILSYDMGTGPVEVTTTPWAVMQWERYTEKPYSWLWEDKPRIEDWCYLAWATVRPTGTVPDDFDLFTMSLTAIRVVGVAPATPTDPVASDA